MLDNGPSRVDSIKATALAGALIYATRSDYVG